MERSAFDTDQERPILSDLPFYRRKGDFATSLTRPNRTPSGRTSPTKPPITLGTLRVWLPAMGVGMPRTSERPGIDDAPGLPRRSSNGRGSLIKPFGGSSGPFWVSPHPARRYWPD